MLRRGRRIYEKKDCKTCHAYIDNEFQSDLDHWWRFSQSLKLPKQILDFAQLDNPLFLFFPSKVEPLLIDRFAIHYFSFLKHECNKTY